MKCYAKTIGELRDLYRNEQIEINPPYQRRPVWKTKQRRLLISSLFNGIPIPALIFHQHFDKVKLKDVYDVLDGKQRLETIFHFIKEKKLKSEGELRVEFVNPNTNREDHLSYDELYSKKIDKDYENILAKFFQYPIPIIIYEGDLTDIFDRSVAGKEVFVRINSTGSPLKKHEIRHAQNSGPFFQLGDKLEKKHRNLFLKRWKVVSKTDIDRYTFHEFILELCTACHFEDYSNRRDKLEQLLSGHKWSKKEIKAIEKRFSGVLWWIKDIFPDDGINHTRFKNKSDFYSLFVVLLKLLTKGFVTTDKKSNKIAGKFLLTFSRQIQNLDFKYPGTQITDIPLSDFEKEIAPYVNATRQATDNKKKREIRDKYLMAALRGGFFLRPKDSKRSFDKAVKDVLWAEVIAKSNNPKCPNPMKNKRCHRHLRYEDAHVDHKYPWSKGGFTKIENAQLLCSNCNSSKGVK